MTLKLQDGKRYIRRDGKIVGPAKWRGYISEGFANNYPFECGGFTYTEQGRAAHYGDSSVDLIEEYIEPTVKATSGLTLKEAIESGHPFKRPDWFNFTSLWDLATYGEAGNPVFDLSAEDLIASDYSLQPEEEVVTISKEQFLNWFKNDESHTADTWWNYFKTYGVVTTRKVEKK